MFRYSIFLVSSSSLFALTTLHVTQNSDNNPGGMGDMGDLRYCLNAMNESLSVPIIDDYAILFDYPMTIQLNGILPIINNSLNPVNITIGNPGSIPSVTIDGNFNSYSGFFIPTGNVTIQNMTFQNLTAKGGNGGDGISGGGGGMGAGGAIYAPKCFLNGCNPLITLMNVTINNCSAIGGNGGNYLGLSSTGDEGGGGGGGFSGNGGSIATTGNTGGAGGGGFGGDGGDILSNSGGGGGGGGIGSRANTGTFMNLGTGGSDQDVGLDGNGYWLSTTAGSGGGGNSGGNNAGGGGGGAGLIIIGGGGGGSAGINGAQPEGNIPPGDGAQPSGGWGGDGGGGGGAGVVIAGIGNGFDGEGGSGGYGGGGGGGAGTGAHDNLYTVKGGLGGLGGGGGGGGVNISGDTSADGGNSSGGGGGGGGGPSMGLNPPGGTDVGHLGGGAGGYGTNSYGIGFGGGGGGGGSGLGAAIFVDSGLNFIIQALPGIPTIFNTTNNTTQAGTRGTGAEGADGSDGSALGNSIFLRATSFLTLQANAVEDLLILGDGVSFVDDTSFNAGPTEVVVTGNGTVVYNGTTDYQSSIKINNANFKVNGVIEHASVKVCRFLDLGTQRGTLSGTGTLTGDVRVNSGTISPDTIGIPLTLGSLLLLPVNPDINSIGSLIHIKIDSTGTSSVAVTGTASLAGILEIDLDQTAQPGTYTVLTSSGITGSFDSVAFPGKTPRYSLSYLPLGTPMFVQFDFLGFYPNALSTQGLHGNRLRTAKYLNVLIPDADGLELTDQFDLLNDLSSSQYHKALNAISPSRNSIPTFAAQNVMFMFSESLNTHFTKRRLARVKNKNEYAKETTLVANKNLLAVSPLAVTQYQSPRKTIYTPPKDTHSQIWGMGFGQFAHQDAQDQTPAFNFNTGGFFAAYDYGNTDQGCIGALAGYAHSSIHEDQSAGNSDLSAGYLSVYGTRFFSDFFIDAALWGEYMSVHQKRKIYFPGFHETAKSSYHAKQLDLHFGAGYDFNIKTLTIEPFGLLDWVSEWDPSYSEKGAAPYNMRISSRTSWMLRFETGLNGYKTSKYNSGILIAHAKLSYVYKKPHKVGDIHATIVHAPASYVVEAFTAQQSLISPALELFWETNWNGYGSISYQGEFGSGYSSNQFYAKIGYSF